MYIDELRWENISIPRAFLVVAKCGKSPRVEE